MAEMALEIARCLDSLTSFNAGTERYEMKGVMGPDEYHDGYPDVDEPGLNNNAYTNVMAAWCAEVALQTLHRLLEDRRVELADSRVVKVRAAVRIVSEKAGGNDRVEPGTKNDRFL